MHDAVVWAASPTRSAPVLRYSTTESECCPRTALRFTADGSKLRCVGDDGVVRSLDVSPFTKPPKDEGYYYGQGVFSGDGRTLALSAGGDVGIWSPLSRTRRSTVTSHVEDMGESVDRIQLSHDGRRLGILSGTKIEIWDTAKKKASMLGSLSVLKRDQHGPYPERIAPYITFAFSPDNTSLAVLVCTDEGTDALTFWDLTTMRRIREVRADLGYPGKRAAVFFQPDGKSVIAAPNIGRVAFPSGKNITEGSASLEVDSLSEDGSTLYTYPRGFRPYIRFRDARPLLPHGEDLRTGAAYGSSIVAPERATAASPDGRLFATAHESAPGCTVKVWDRRTGTELGVPLTGPLEEILTLAFSPDGSTLTGVDRHGRFFTDSIAPARLIRDLCARSGPLTKQEWNAHIPDIPYRETC